MDNIDNLKVPPHSIDAEQSILGGLLLDNDAWIQIADFLSEIDFYRHDHRLIFQSIKHLVEINQPCDVVTLSEYLKGINQLDEAGGFTYIGNLASNTPSAANIKAYANIVRERSVLRQLIKAGTDITESGFNADGRNSAELLEEAEQKVFQIADSGEKSKTGFRGMEELLKMNVDRIDELFHSDNDFTGLPTTFTDLDKITLGLQPADLIIVAGRPSMGKTTFAMNIAENVAIAAKKPVAIFSMEMPSESLTLRMLSSLGRINQGKIRSGKLDEDDMARLTSAIAILNQASIHIDDTPALSPLEMKARIRRLKREHDIGLIVIDYLQLMQIPGKGDNRVNEISEISRGLKALAKEMNVPVIALSQLNRGLEQRTDKRPVMSDLRESGAIEQDADLILFIYRDEVYNPETEHKGTGEIIISKHRNGELGKAYLTFLGQYSRFENHASVEYEQYN